MVLMESPSGHVRIYSLDDGIWVQVGQDIDGEAAYDYFGCIECRWPIGAE